MVNYPLKIPNCHFVIYSFGYLLVINSENKSNKLSLTRRGLVIRGFKFCFDFLYSFTTSVIFITLYLIHIDLLFFSYFLLFLPYQFIKLRIYLINCLLISINKSLISFMKTYVSFFFCSFTSSILGNSLPFLFSRTYSLFMFSPTYFLNLFSWFKASSKIFAPSASILSMLRLLCIAIWIW